MKKRINAKQLKNMLTLKDYENILDSLNAEWKSKSNNQWILYTGCHNLDWLAGSPKLYFYTETKFFTCYTGCNESFDIYSLIEKRWELEHREFTFYDILIYVGGICDISIDDLEFTPPPQKTWQEVLSKYTNKKKGIIDIKVYDKWILKFLEPIYHQSFIDDGISIETMEKFNVEYYKYGQQITIPVYTQTGELAGIHARNMCPALVEMGYKYIPLTLDSGDDFRFKTSHVLFGLNLNKGNIEYTKSIVLTEAPKSVMQLDSILEYNNSVALFGMNLSRIQRDMILSLGVTDVYIALDKQYEHITLEDDENEPTKDFTQYRQNVLKIADMLREYCNVYAIYDDIDLLDYKDSPSDKGAEVWNTLYNRKELI